MKSIVERIILLEPSWDEETNKLVDDLCSRLAMVETDLGVLNSRIAKSWPTEKSNLYTQEEVDRIKEDMYIAGQDQGYEFGYEICKIDLAKK